jgi:hypothetical protein
MRPPGNQRISAKRLLIQHDTQVLSGALDHAYPPREASCFDEVLKAIDGAERKVWGSGDPIKDPRDS